MGDAYIPHRVRDSDFLEQSHNKERQTDGEVVQPWPEGLGIVELREHLAVMRDWASNQMRKEGYEKAIVEEVVLSNRAVMSIDQVCNLLKGKE